MNEFYKDNFGVLYNGDSKDILQKLPKQSVYSCITSPPYWALRDYHTSRWSGGDESCDHVKDKTKTKVFGNPEFNKNRPSREATKLPGYYFDDICEKCGAVKIDKQLGQEPTFTEYIEKLCSYFDLVWNILLPEGTLWVNLGDTYYGGAKGQGSTSPKQSTNKGSIYRLTNTKKFSNGELPDKSLCLIPPRFAIAMQERGWVLRNDIIWHKPNKFPESVKDRFTHDYEHLFMFSKPNDISLWANSKTLDVVYEKPDLFGKEGVDFRINEKGKKISYWKSREYYFRQQLEPVKESSIKRVQTGWHGKIDAGVSWTGNSNYLGSDKAKEQILLGRNVRSVWSINTESERGGTHFAKFPKELIRTPILASCPEGGVVLDPFFGSGTVAVVCEQLGRKWVGIELSSDYCEQSIAKIKKNRDSEQKYGDSAEE